MCLLCVLNDLVCNYTNNGNRGFTMETYEKLVLNPTYRVTLHRNLIEADFSKSLTLIEQKVLYTAISNIPAPIYLKENGEWVLDENEKKIITNPITELPKFTMSVKEFSNLLGWKEVDYKKLIKFSESLMGKVITVDSGKGVEQFQWVTYTSYKKGEGKVLIELHPRLLPYVANLTENFASVALGEITNFKSKYSSRLYFLLKQWAKLGNKTIELNELRKILGVGYTEIKGVRVYKLEKYYHLKQRALIPAIEEINKFTDLNISIEEIIEGQKYVGLTFYIGNKEKKSEQKPKAPQAKPPMAVTTYDEIAQTLLHLGFNKKAYENISKRLSAIENVETIQNHVIAQLQKLGTYVLESKNELGAGFVISEVEKAVVRYGVDGNFNFDELIVGEKPQVKKQATRQKQGRDESVPDWFYEQKEEQEQKQDETKEPETKVTNGEIDFEKERLKILAKLEQAQ